MDMRTRCYHELLCNQDQVSESPIKTPRELLVEGSNVIVSNGLGLGLSVTGSSRQENLSMKTRQANDDIGQIEHTMGAMETTAASTT